MLIIVFGLFRFPDALLLLRGRVATAVAATLLLTNRPSQSGPLRNEREAQQLARRSP